MKLPALIVLTAATLAACRSARDSASAHDYRVTTSPLQVGGGISLCIALDLSDRQGVWWWTPGQTGCDTRSSGPGLFKPEGASVSGQAPSGSTSIAFRVGTHSQSRPFIDVQLTLEGDVLRSQEAGAHVAVQRRASLDIPEVPTRGRGPGG